MGNYVETHHVSCHHGNIRCCPDKVMHHHGNSVCCTGDVTHHYDEDGRYKEGVTTGVQHVSVTSNAGGHCDQSACRYHCDGEARSGIHQHKLVNNNCNERSPQQKYTDNGQYQPDTSGVHAKQSHVGDVVVSSHRELEPSHRYTTDRPDGKRQNVTPSKGQRSESSHSYATNQSDARHEHVEVSCHSGPQHNQSHDRQGDVVVSTDTSKRGTHEDQLHTTLSAAVVSSYNENHHDVPNTHTNDQPMDRRGSEVIVSNDRESRGDQSQSHINYDQSDSRSSRARVLDNTQYREEPASCNRPARDERDIRYRDVERTRQGQLQAHPMQHESRDSQSNTRYQDPPGPRESERSKRPQYQERYQRYSRMYDSTAGGSGDARPHRYPSDIIKGHFDYSKYDGDKVLIKTRIMQQQPSNYQLLGGRQQKVNNVRLSDIRHGRGVRTQSALNYAGHGQRGDGYSAHHSNDPRRVKVEMQQNAPQSELRRISRSKSPLKKSNTTGPVDGSLTDAAAREGMKQLGLKTNEKNKQVGEKDISNEVI